MKLAKDIFSGNDKFSEVRALFFVGDIHGDFLAFRYKIIEHDYRNCILVLCGDIGFGFQSMKDDYNEILKLQGFLEEYNINVLALRGNHDNPEYFTNTNIICNWFNVKDYEIINTIFGNILFIGGARSVDKTKRTLNKNWWEGETILPMTDEILEELNKYPIDIVATHSAPNFCMPLRNDNLLAWATVDDTVLKDCNNERLLLSNIYTKLSENHKIKLWYYGHFHDVYYTLENDCKFHGLNILQFYPYRY